MDEATGQFLAALTTGTECGDCSAAPDLIDQVGVEIAQFSADGAYDTETVYREAAKRGARTTIPPWEGAVLRQGGDPDRYLERNRNLAEIHAKGKQKRKRTSGYSQGSNAETAFSRIKRRLGDKLHTRKYDNHICELLFFPGIINIMTAVGMPKATWTPA